MRFITKNGLYFGLLLITLSLQCHAEKPDVIGTCGGSYKNILKGKIASPGFPTSNYNNSESCTYSIEVPLGYRIAYRSLWMDVEPQDENGCTDLIAIFPTEDLSERIDLCSNSSLYIESTDGRKLNIVFETDASVTASGFVIEWTAFKDLPSSLNCSFDGPLPLCPGWSQASDDDIDWSFIRGPTPSQNTGPEVDHTTGTEEGRYAYIEASQQEIMSNAILYSPIFQVNEAKGYCLSFWFMNRDDDDSNPSGGEIYVYIKFDDEEPSLVFETKQVTRNEWQNVKLDVKFSQDYQKSAQLLFEAIRGVNYRSDVAIDDIIISEGLCSNNKTTTDTSTDYEKFDYFYNEIACADGEHECDGLCLPQEYICNGIDDCSDKSDEANCTVSCPNNLEFQQCASACNRSCDDDETFVCEDQNCVSRCACPLSLPVLYQGRCIKYNDCPEDLPEFDFVQDFKIANITSTSVEVEFKQVSGINSYKIELFQLNADGSPGLKSTIEQNAFQNDFVQVTQRVSFLQLMPESTYNVQVISVKDSVEKFSNVKEFTTKSSNEDSIDESVESNSSTTSPKVTTETSKRCGYTVENGTEGTVISPNFNDGFYNNSLDCLYEINVAPGYVIEFEGNVEIQEQSGGVCLDKVEIFLSGKEDDLFEEFCGNQVILPEATTNNILLIRFTSDSSITGKGFVINWKRINLSNRAPSFNCSFDQAIPMCAGWKQDLTDSSDWEFSRSVLEPGPKQDNTDINLYGKFAYVFAPQNSFDNKAMLETPFTNFTSDSCLSYSVWIGGPMYLNVEAVTKNGTVIPIDLVLDLGRSEWILRQHKISDYVKDKRFKIRFSTDGGGTTKSYVALDDVSLSPNSCEEESYYTYTDGNNYGSNYYSNLLDEETTTSTSQETTTASTSQETTTASTSQETTTASTSQETTTASTSQETTTASTSQETTTASTSQETTTTSKPTTDKEPSTIPIATVEPVTTANKNLSCEEQRLLLSSVNQSSEYPKCSEDGNFELVQCFLSSDNVETCSCVNPATGVPFKESFQPQTGFQLPLDCSGCNNSGVVYSNEASACDFTCSNPNPICTFQLVSRCVCPSDKPFLHNQKCITFEECPQDSLTTETNNISDKTDPLQSTATQTTVTPQPTSIEATTIQSITTAEPLNYNFDIRLTRMTESEAYLVLFGSQSIKKFVLEVYVNGSTIPSIKEVNRTSPVTFSRIGELPSGTGFEVVMKGIGLDDNQLFTKSSVFKTQGLAEVATTTGKPATTVKVNIEPENYQIIEIINITESSVDFSILSGNDIKKYQVQFYIEGILQPLVGKFEKKENVDIARLAPLPSGQNILMIVDGLDMNDEVVQTTNVSFTTESQESGLTTVAMPLDITQTFTTTSLDRIMDVSVAQITEDQIDLVIYGSENISMYNVYLSLNGIPASKVTEFKKFSAFTSAKIDGLPSGATIEAVIRGLDSKGVNLDEKRITFTTLEKLEVTSSAYEATTVENQRQTTTSYGTFADDTFNATINNITRNEAVVVIEAGSSVVMFQTTLYSNFRGQPVVNSFNRENEFTFIPISSLPSGARIYFDIEAILVDGSSRLLNLTWQTEEAVNSTDQPIFAADIFNVDYRNISYNTVDLMILGGSNVYMYRILLLNKKSNTSKEVVLNKEEAVNVLKLQLLQPGTKFEAIVEAYFTNNSTKNITIEFETLPEEFSKDVITTETPSETSVQPASESISLDDGFSFSFTNLTRKSVRLVFESGASIERYQVEIYVLPNIQAKVYEIAKKSNPIYVDFVDIPTDTRYRAVGIAYFSNGTFVTENIFFSTYAADVPTTTTEPTTEPATTEPATTEPATTEPATTEPTTREPITTEPATTEPATTEPATTEPATTKPATTEPTTREPIITERATTEPITANPTTTQQTTTASPTTREQGIIGTTTGEQTTEQQATEQVTTTRDLDQTSAKQTTQMSLGTSFADEMQETSTAKNFIATATSVTDQTSMNFTSSTEATSSFVITIQATEKDSFATERPSTFTTDASLSTFESMTVENNSTFTTIPITFKDSTNDEFSAKTIIFTTTPARLQMFQWKILDISSDKFFVRLKSVSQVVSLDVSLLTERNEVVEMKQFVLDSSEVVVGFDNLIPDKKYSLILSSIDTDGTLETQKLEIRTKIELDNFVEIQATPVNESVEINIFGGSDISFYQIALFAENISFPYMSYIPREGNLTTTYFLKLPKASDFEVVVKATAIDGSVETQDLVEFKTEGSKDEVTYEDTIFKGFPTSSNEEVELTTQSFDNSSAMINDRLEVTLATNGQREADIIIYSGSDIKFFEILLFEKNTSLPTVKYLDKVGDYTYFLLQYLKPGSSYSMQVKGMKDDGTFKTEDFFFSTLHADSTLPTITSALTTSSSKDDYLEVRLGRVGSDYADIFILGGVSYIYYDIVLYFENNPSPSIQSRARVSSVMQEQLEPLKPDSNYTLVIRAVKSDNTIQTKMLSFITNQKLDVTTDSYQTTANMFDDSLSFEITDISDKQASMFIYSGTEVIAYDISIYVDGLLYQQIEKIEKQEPITRIELDLLQPGMYYTVELTAFLTNGNTKFLKSSFMTTSRRQKTTQQTITTDEMQSQTKPADLFSVEVIDIDKESATLVIAGSYKIPSYEVTLYKENIRLKSSGDVPRTGEVTYTTIQPLKPGTQYTVVVVARLNDVIFNKQNITFETQLSTDEYTTTPFTTFEETSTQQAIDTYSDQLEAHLAYVDSNQANFVILSGDNFDFFKILLYNDRTGLPNVIQSTRTSYLTRIKLTLPDSSSNFTIVVEAYAKDKMLKSTVIGFDTKADDFDILNVDYETVCLRIRNKKIGERSYTVAIDQESVDSKQGFSKDVRTIKESKGPYSYTCFYDLIEGESYTFILSFKQNNQSFKSEKNFKLGFGDEDYKSKVEYPDNKENIRWRKQYNNWREQTYNVWAKSMVSYQYDVATILELEPNPKKCPIIVRPRCLSEPNHFVDYNGCLFFICTDPPKDGGVYKREVDAYNLDSEIFSNYLMPEWGSLMEQYSNERSKRMP